MYVLQTNLPFDILSAEYRQWVLLDGRVKFGLLIHVNYSYDGCTKMNYHATIRLYDFYREPKWMKKNAIAVNNGRKAREARQRERDNAAVKDK